MPDAERPIFSRWDLLNPTNFLSLALLGFACAVFLHPNDPTTLPSYARFDDLMSWPLWGWWAALTALLIQVTPRTTGWRTAAYFLCVVFTFGVSAALSWSVGTTPAVFAWGVYFLIACTVFARSFALWQKQFHYWQRLRDDPPRWLRRLARVGEFGDGDDGQR